MNRTTTINTILNIALAAGKLAAGILWRSSALLSESADNAADAFMSIVSALGVRAAAKPADAEHRYGHERMECVFTLVVAGIMAVAGCGVALRAISGLMYAGSAELAAPDFPAMLVAVFAAGVKVIMWRRTKAAAKHFDSTALRASALNYRNDIFAGLCSFAGILGAKLGLPVLDPLIGLGIAGLVLKSTADVFLDASRRLTDQSADEETVEQIRAVITSTNGVIRLDDLKTRVFNSRIYADVEIAADSSLSLTDAHLIAENVHDRLEMQFPKIKHCSVHVNPSEEF
jgi:cation diffusion facilitator family transporter